jgi:hypothetical protein
MGRGSPGYKFPGHRLPGIVQRVSCSNMESILELMKRNAVPAAVMRTASKGTLPIPDDRMLEVLVYLTSIPLFAHDARMTLAQWDLKSAIKIVGDSATSPEVLGYYWAQANRRPELMPALIENPTIPENLLMELSAEAPREIVNMLLASPRVRNSPAIMEALATNLRVVPQYLKPHESQALASEPAVEVKPEPGQSSGTGFEAPAKSAPDPETEAVYQAFEREHAAEIEAEEGKAFQLVEAEKEIATADAAVEPQEAPPAGGPGAESSAEPATETPVAIAAERQTAVVPAQPKEEKKLTLLQKLGRMSPSERVKAAFTGSREERAVLIRDGAKVVQNAVLASPKLTEPEVEVFAAAKNVHDNVLREIARNRRFMKNYAIMRNLVLNPKTPLDISMPLVKMLMVFDLKSLQRSRSISETIRKLAAKFYREKAMSGGRTKE